MKVLLAILSCDKDRYYAACQRETCLKDAKIDYRYFLGCKAKEPDEVQLDCGDGYVDLPFKTQEICRWALAHGYDYIFKADVDTYIHVPRLLAEHYWEYAYQGYYRGDHIHPGGYASGGSGYWLSRWAMKRVLDVTMRPDSIDPIKPERCYVWGEDLQVGHALYSWGIVCHWSDKYRLDAELPHPDNDIVTNHNVVHPNKGNRMRQAHQQVLENFGV